MNFTLTMPPSTNSLYRYTTKGGRSFAYRTKEYRGWISDNMLSLINCNRSKTALNKNCYVGIHYYLKFDRDVDNGKAILDMLEHAGIIVNDRQVTFMNLQKEFDKENPRVEVEIEEIA